MRENEFEKRVQQKMGDFHLHPSDEVWTEVERRIHKEKKRRILAWWPLFFLLAGGGIAAGILLTNKKEKNETIAVNKKSETLIQSSIEKASVPEPTANSTNRTNIDTTASKINTIEKSKTDEAKIIRQHDEPNLVTNKGIMEKSIIASPGKKIKKVSSDKNVVVYAYYENDKQEPDLAVKNSISSKPVTTSTDSIKAIHNIVATAKHETVGNDKPEVQGPQTSDSATKEQTTKSQNKKTKKWDWGIHFSASRSSIGNGVSFGNSRLYFDNLSSSQVFTPPGLANFYSSPLRSSFSWATGVYFKRAVSKKLDFNAGLGYTYLSTKMNIGSRVESARQINNYYTQGLTVNNFYRSGSNSSHTNGYHFISLSADLSWRIINGKKINIYWDNGLSFSRMLGSSMLHYDRNLQGYYKDNSLLGKNQLAYTTGFSIPVSKRLQVNPFVSYNLTPVLKNSDTLHFTNYGIRIRFLMNKK